MICMRETDDPDFACDEQAHRCSKPRHTAHTHYNYDLHNFFASL